MIKTYLVPITDEVIKLMEKGEAPSFLHCAACLDGLTNGEVFLKLNETAQIYGIDKEKDIIKVCFDNENIVPISYSWWNRKWGETE